MHIRDFFHFSISTYLCASEYLRQQVGVCGVDSKYSTETKFFIMKEHLYNTVQLCDFFF